MRMVAMQADKSLNCFPHECQIVANVANKMCRCVTLPVGEWLHICFPGDPLPLELVYTDFRPFSDIELRSGERAMYTSLCNGFNDLFRKLDAREYSMGIVDDIPSQADAASAEKRDGLPRNALLALYSMQNAARAGHPSPVSSSSTADSGSQYPVQQESHSPHESRLQATAVWAWAELLVDVKNRRASAPSVFFDLIDSSKDASSVASDRLQHWDEVAEHATEMCFRQHRTSMPMITVYHDYARLLRFGPAGVILSEPFNYIEDPEPFCTFLFRYLRASRQTRGFDPTATLASRDELEIFTKLTDNQTLPVHVRDTLRIAVTPGWPLHKLSYQAPWSADGTSPVRPETPRSIREFLVGRPSYRSHSMMGNGTRAFVAYDLERRTVVFIKDYWRLDLGPDYLTEREVYLELSKDFLTRPLHVPTLLGGGDVFDARMETQRSLAHAVVAASRSGHVDRDGVCPGRVHTRLVFKEVCRPLESFKDARELASVVHDALLAHKHAWKEHGILHCDISAGNILILDTANDGAMMRSVGLLCDWDLAKRRVHIAHPEMSQPTRLGAWPFMAAALQWYPRKPHLLSDDLESAYHTLNWCTLKYLPHGSTDMACLPQEMNTIYKLALPDGRGSSLKFRSVQNGYPFVFDLECSPNHPFLELLTRLGHICQEHYTHFPPKLVEQDAIEGNFEFPGDPDDDCPPPDHQHLYGYGAILDAFSAALQQSEWPEIPKLPDQVPDSTPCSKVHR
ncbi:uncharacterized protein TRAVEDRAFT_52317 [Trametes versicolor FP-101664 SS1]|uniref:uncharacterized protein n=1 Tax=Trametes versicolor (strain FP-101664) TaxID=717944 RepID=UPI0004621569|nr:uncharacterized protein TRAVEDRAFT_52317 [Trametes versicolor FP-101664 SS1]EIW53182.1 hypothetical protein TRAVEDRAFT_52317 [Trametes versicolor FP-101664 SS1]